MAEQQDDRVQFAVLLEDVRSGLRTVAEGHTVLNQKIEREVAQLGQSLGSRIGPLETAVRDGFRDLRTELGGVRTEIRDLRVRFEEHLSAHTT